MRMQKEKTVVQIWPGRKYHSLAEALERPPVLSEKAACCI